MMHDPLPGSRKAMKDRGASLGNRETRKFMRRLIAAGGEIRASSGKGHPRLFYRGAFVASISLSPSDSRAEKNVLAKARRAGMSI
ncbi:hypothetical protein GoPhGRU1p91 [Gordonia phage GRU1]|uniref:HicA-like toxin n=1 Tax=Gordonia phage GRU1 TaxID=1109710 RepID=G8EK50_9CAUD|nr:hypothetical protein GoPhGRU1p91 [Gordonia phage GRU1]AET09932.1 hypothetical protein [Gordonia phage GRU1]WAA19637.1 HicA-like toxin [Gordonia phage Dalilpop]